MKKIMIAGVILCIVLMQTSCGHNNMDKQYNDASKEISDLTNDKTFLEADVEERYELALNLIKELEAEGTIRNVYYDKDNGMFSFEFSNGAAGGISLMDRAPYFN